jgi:hypothetical protein
MSTAIHIAALLVHGLSVSPLDPPRVHAASARSPHSLQTYCTWKKTTTTSVQPTDGSGSTLATPPRGPKDGVHFNSMFFNCQTGLVSRFKEMFPDDFVYKGDRELKFEHDDVVPVNKLRACIELALTYNLDKSCEQPSKARRKHGK